MELKKTFGVVVNHTESGIAAMAQQVSYTPRCVVVIDMKTLARQRSIRAGCTLIALCGHHRGVTI
jgi:hypothetical protein